MTDSRAVATLPNLIIAILRHEAPAEGAEFLSIMVRATRLPPSRRG